MIKQNRYYNHITRYKTLIYKLPHTNVKLKEEKTAFI